MAVSGCPAWCQTDHAAADPQSVYVSQDGRVVYHLRHHERDLAQFPNPDAGRNGSYVYVGISRTDDLKTGQTEPAGVHVDGAGEMSAELARKVAAAIAHAAELLARDAALPGRPRRLVARCRREVG